MKKPLSIKLTALALSLCLLGSTFNLVLSTHFCGGSLKTWSLIGEAEKCSPEEMKEGCSLASQEFSGHQVNKKPCCQDRRFVLGSETDREEPTIFQAAHHFDLLGDLVAVAPDVASLPTLKKIASSRLYKPPTVVHLIYLLHEVFRI